MGDPSAVIYGGGQQPHIFYRDAAGKIWDSWYSGQQWQLQQINLSGVTDGPAAVSDPSSFTYGGGPELHILYRDAAGKIWDSWYDGQRWNLQQINLLGVTEGPAAEGKPAPFVSEQGTQPHILYRDAEGAIWDAWYDGRQWNLQQLNRRGETHGPGSAGDPSAFIYANGTQTNVLYRDDEGAIWDCVRQPGPARRIERH